MIWKHVSQGLHFLGVNHEGLKDRVTVRSIKISSEENILQGRSILCELLLDGGCHILHSHETSQPNFVVEMRVDVHDETAILRDWLQDQVGVVSMERGPKPSKSWSFGFVDPDVAVFSDQELVLPDENARALTLFEVTRFSKVAVEVADLVQDVLDHADVGLLDSEKIWQLFQNSSAALDLNIHTFPFRLSQLCYPLSTSFSQRRLKLITDSSPAPKNRLRWTVGTRTLQLRLPSHCISVWQSS